MAQFLSVWVPIISGLLGIFVTAATFLIPYIKNAKAKKILETAVKVAEAVQPYIIEAEKFANYSGEEKKAYVMTKANQYAIEHKLNFNAEEVSKQVESLVNLTKQVNQREKDKVATEKVDIQEQPQA